MVSIGCVTGSEAGEILSQASIPDGALVVGFSLAEYALNPAGSPGLSLAYAYKV